MPQDPFPRWAVETRSLRFAAVGTLGLLACGVMAWNGLGAFAWSTAALSVGLLAAAWAFRKPRAPDVAAELERSLRRLDAKPGGKP